MEFFHIPDKLQRIVLSYYSSFQMRFSTQQYTTGYQALEVGIPMGCTVSPILFVMSMELMIKATQCVCKGVEIAPGMELPPVRAFMDDLTLLNPSVEESKKGLDKLEEVTDWCNMKFKPKKSRSLVLKKGKLDREQSFSLSGEHIPSIQEEPVKSLGRWYTESLTDVGRVAEIETQLLEGLSSIDKCYLPSQLKLWCLKYGLYPRISWPLAMYEVALTHVERFERKISGYIRKWLGLPPGVSNIAFYGQANKLLLPLTALTEEFKVEKARVFLTLRDSQDAVIRDTLPEVRTGRKWSVSKEVDEMESILRHKEIVGHVQTSKAGLGNSQTRFFSKATYKEKKDMIVGEIRNKEEQARLAKAVGQGQQGRWTAWEEVESKKLSWSEIWAMEPLVLRFVIHSTYDVLPTPKNISVWNSDSNPSCHKCGAIGTLKHILSACPRSLADGMYTWRHNQVLEAFSDTLADAIAEANKESNTQKVPNIQFHKEGQQPSNTSSKPKHGILAAASDWKLLVDLESQMVFPREITVTNMRPDIVIWSMTTKTTVLGELTVPWEENVGVANEFKKDKYVDLVEQCKSQGFKVLCHPVEIGCRGFGTKSLTSFLCALGVQNKLKRKLTQEALRRASRASQWIWSKYRAGDRQ